MSELLFYKPAPRWQIWAALGASVAIHLGAGAAADTKAVPAGPGAEEPAVVTIETADPPQVETPPPIDIPLPPAPTPIDDRLFTESTPPPVQRRSQAATPVVRRTSSGPPAPVSIGAAKVVAISAPRPEYPYEARRQHATGTGVAILYVDQATGFVTSVSMTQSTGNATLDNATVSAFKRWRFKAGAVSVVRTPITFTLMGAQY
jgi:TonB family protein